MSGAFPRHYFSTHGTPFVKQLIIAKHTHWLQNTVGCHEIDRLIFERPANNLVGDAKTVTSSEFSAYQGTKMCIGGESPRNLLLRLEWGGAGVSYDWCIMLEPIMANFIPVFKVHLSGILLNQMIIVILKLIINIWRLHE